MKAAVGVLVGIPAGILAGILTGSRVITAGRVPIPPTVVVGILAGILALVALVSVLRRYPLDQLVVVAATVVALGLSAQGAYRLLVERLHMTGWTHAGVHWEAAVVAAVAELAILAEAARAERAIRDTGDHGGHAGIVWVIAAGAGLIVATGAHSIPEMLVRLSVPPLVAGLWWWGVRDRVKVTDVDEADRWVRGLLRRVLVVVGVARPGAGSLEELVRERRGTHAARLVSRLDSGPGWVRARRRRRLQRLAEHADEETVSRARTQLEATRSLLRLAGIVDESTRESATVRGESVSRVAAARVSESVVSLPVSRGESTHEHVVERQARGTDVCGCGQYLCSCGWVSLASLGRHRRDGCPQ